MMWVSYMPCTYAARAYPFAGARAGRTKGSLTERMVRIITRVLSRYRCSYSVHLLTVGHGAIIDAWTVDLDELRRAGVSDSELRMMGTWHCKGAVSIEEQYVGEAAEVHADIPFMIPSTLMFAYRRPLTLASPLDRWAYLSPKFIIDMPFRGANLVRELHVHMFPGGVSVHINMRGTVTYRDAEHVALEIGELIGNAKEVSTNAFRRMREYVRSKIATQSHTGVVHYASRYLPVWVT